MKTITLGANGMAQLTGTTTVTPAPAGLVLALAGAAGDDRPDSSGGLGGTGCDFSGQ